jgi:hypothetical protein
VFARDGVPEPTLAAFGGSPQRTEPN